MQRTCLKMIFALCSFSLVFVLLPLFRKIFSELIKEKEKFTTKKETLTTFLLFKHFISCDCDSYIHLFQFDFSAHLL